ncbi:MAG: intradiol ring-cleavage dioxygenase [Myxococcota bacterium]|nr:intradiol ring-cleavage dioxygenase [Myxococcota bacterium]
MATNRREFLGFSIGSFLIAACGSAHESLAATPGTPDDDGTPPDEAFAASSCSPRSCEATADNIEGPFYKAGAPHRAVIATDKDAGERLVISGVVRDTHCTPIANATLDIWQADARGGYDNDGWGLRGRMTTDKRGRFQLSSIVPGRYLNGRRYRPTHVHVKLRAPNMRELTTQLYFEGDPYNEGDDFIVKQLIMQHAKSGGVRRAAFDFVLATA